MVQNAYQITIAHFGKHSYLHINTLLYSIFRFDILCAEVDCHIILCNWTNQDGSLYLQHCLDNYRADVKVNKLFLYSLSFLKLEVTHVPEIFLYICKMTRWSCHSNIDFADVLVTQVFRALSNHFWINTVYFAQSRITTCGPMQNIFFA